MKFNDLADLEILKECLAETDFSPELGEDKETDLILPEDKEIVCKDCGKEFIFTVEEQQFYKERHLREPKRCKICAKARRKFFRHKGDK